MRKPSLSKVLAPAAMALAVLLASPALAVPSILMPYGAGVAGGTPGYRYTIQPMYSALPGFEAPSFDDSGWAMGAAPFGASGGLDGTCSTLWPLVVTPWSPVNTDLFVRFHVEMCPGVAGVRVGTAIDNDLVLFVNGFEVVPVGGCAVESIDGLCQTEGCAFPDKLVYDVPDGLILPGDNVFAIHARDRHSVAFLDVQVSADLSSQVCTPLNDPPLCEGAFADPGQLWPPNHKWNAIGIGGITDPEGGETTVTITSIYQDEPVDVRGNGDGNTCPDGAGVGTGSASVRAERQAAGDGRVYHIGFTATDPDGGVCQGTVSVCVPHDQGLRSSCIDQGALFDSTVCP